ncbi:MAG: hypothetical protein GF346_00670 [Candidatus Eisenbacteria bacterium]|nr:hypothetical protein [Candidatus Latescibacterota bacterium]MBD3300944.1 hypothetical protein [Candidatus Eisenbacteria bacterium]
MRTLAFLSLLSILVAAPAVADPSPWPDPVEREAFQRAEMERFAHLAKAFAQEDPARRAEQDRYDALSYRLELDLRSYGAGWLFGVVEAEIRVVDESLDAILFDLSAAMPVDSAFVDGAPAEFTHAGGDLTITPPDPLAQGSRASVRVHYQGDPSGGASGAFGWDEHDGTPLIWTLSEPIGARDWWPCKDSPHDKADSLDVLLRVENWMVPTSNGLLVDVREEDDGSLTYHWSHRYPITTYLVSVTASDFVRIAESYPTAEGDTLLLEHFVYPEKVDQAHEDFSITGPAIDVLADRFGPYPFPEEKYGHTLFGWGGAMEHQTNTSYGARLVNGSHTYDWILVHEAAHQWWGDMTSPADWREIWLNEGFASYAEALWFEEQGGPETYRAYMNTSQFVRDPSGPLYDPPALFDTNTVYNKGAWAVHMLRGVLGDSLFFAGLAEYRARTAYRSTTTAELREILEEVSGRPLDWFFDPWIYGVDRPQYVVSFLPTGEPGMRGVAVHIDQVQRGAPFFPMPIDLRIDLSGGGSIRERVFNDPDHQDFEFEVPVEPTAVVLDPDGWILKSVETAPYGMHITTTDLPPGIADSLYSVSLQGRGGEPPYVWSAEDPLPGALALDPDTGVLRGTAPDSGAYVFSVRLDDSRSRIDTQRYRWTVGASPDSGVVDPPDTTVVAGGARLRIGPIPAHRWAQFAVEGVSAGPVTVTLYDPAGRRVRVLWDGAVPGRPIVWEGHDERGEKVPSGVYLARMNAGGKTVTRRLVWLWGE